MYPVPSVVAEKYRVERVLGEGGMGMVVEATHIALGNRVALKFLHRHLVDNQALMERFLREARSSARLRSEHVCRVSDFGTFEDGTAYIVMELLHGTDLAHLLRTKGPLPAELACAYVLQACVGLAEAHQLRIVHRDLKPANLFLTVRPDGTPLVKVLDFGVAKAPQEGDLELTQTSNVMGSPGYMSPEQLRSSRDVDPRSDIWSLGVTLYELVSGNKPWSAESITELTLRIVMDPFAPLPAHVAPGLAQVIARCMEKDPNARFPTISDLAAWLAPFAGPGGRELASGIARVLGVAPVIIPTPASAVAPTIVSTATRAECDDWREKSRRSRRLALVIAGACVVGAGIAGLVLLGGGERGGSQGRARPVPASLSPPPSMPAPGAVPATAMPPDAGPSVAAAPDAGAPGASSSGAEAGEPREQDAAPRPAPAVKKRRRPPHKVKKDISDSRI